MKLDTLKAGGRDGTLIVVSRDLRRAVRIPEIASTLQAALDDWERTSPALEEIAAKLGTGPVNGEFAFDASEVASPVPSKTRQMRNLPHRNSMTRWRSCSSRVT